MSSYTIEKVEYVKLAALLYGHEEKKRYEERWTYFMLGVRKQMERCYLLNLASVNKQYGEHYKADRLSYESEWQDYVEIGRRIKTKDLLQIAKDFFDCADYQTEDKKCAEQMNAWFSVVLRHLMPRGAGRSHIEVDESQLEPAYEDILEMIK